jgi:hypothetical protein
MMDPNASPVPRYQRSIEEIGARGNPFEGPSTYHDEIPNI